MVRASVKPSLTRDRAVARSTMDSRGLVQTWTPAATDRHGKQTGSYVDQAEGPVGLSEPRTRETPTEAVLSDWVARLPWGTAINSNDHYKITEINGTAVSIVCSVVGEVHHGETAVLLSLKRETGVTE